MFSFIHRHSFGKCDMCWYQNQPSKDWMKVCVVNEQTSEYRVWEDNYGHGWQNSSELPSTAWMGLRLPGTSVPQQPVLHSGKGNSLFRGWCGSSLQLKGAQAEILLGAQRWHNQVIPLYEIQTAIAPLRLMLCFMSAATSASLFR